MENKIITEYDVPVEMRDETVLRANIYRPASEGPWPVLLTRLPYGKDVPNLMLDPTQAARKGYVVIVQDTRGRYASEGDWDLIPSMNKESSDGIDTIHWVTKLPYNNGQIGMYGFSYFAFTQWAVMFDDHRALKAAVPAFSWSDPFDGLLYRGGAIELGFLAFWQLPLYMDTHPRNYQDDHKLAEAMSQLISDINKLKIQIKSLPLKDFAPFKRNQVAPSILQAIQHGANRDYADALTVKGKYEELSVPTLNIAGWYDIFLQGTIENFVQMRSKGGSSEARQSKLVIGPWAHLDHSHHAGEVNFGMAAHSASVDFRELQIRWFDHFLKGIDTGVTIEAPVKLFVMGANIWRDEQEWPLARTQYVRYYMHSHGHANTLHGDGVLEVAHPEQEEPDHFAYDPKNPVPTVGGATMMPPDYNPGPYNQREIESREDVLVYTSPVLEEDLEVTGPVKVVLWAISSAPDTDFVARLVDVHPDGYTRNLTDGIIRTRYRNAAKGAQPNLIEPGKAYEYEISLWATSNLFMKGHRIRLDITSSSFPRWDRNPNTGHDVGEDAEIRIAQQTILHDTDHPSHIVLPVIPRLN